jgi:hypothetical protein
MWRRIAVVGGALGWMLPVWQGIKWLLEWAEHIDFARQHIADIKYVGQMLAFLANPPPWLGIALIPPASLAIWWGLRGGTSRRDVKTETPAVSLEQATSVITAPAAVPSSNSSGEMTITAHDGRQQSKAMPDVWLQDAVCYAVHGRWLREDERAFAIEHFNKATKIMKEMRQLAGDGEYIIWGKLDQYGLDQKIPTEFWIDNQIELTRILGDFAENARTEKATHGHSRRYDGLKANRLLTEKLWPEGGGRTLAEPS